MQQKVKKAITKTLLGVAVFVGVAVFYFGYAFIAGARMLPGLWIGQTPVGGLTRAEATLKVGEAVKVINEHGIIVAVDQKSQTIAPADIGLNYDIAATVANAASYGRRPVASLAQLIRYRVIRAAFVSTYDERQVDQSIDDIAAATDVPKRDLHLELKNGTVKIADDIAPGLRLDGDVVHEAVVVRITSADPSPVTAERIHEEPSVTPEGAEAARAQAQNIIKESITLMHGERVWIATPSIIGAWLDSESNGPALTVIIDKEKVGQYVATLAEQINAKTTAPRLTVQEGKVVDFHMPKPSAALEEKKAIADLVDLVEKRRTDSNAGAILTLAVNESATPELPDNFRELGIIELIGTATTSMAGSPTNRRLNIKNGVKFLTGILIDPGAEFSTIKTLGTIDNTTGYLPELVIKGNRTTPEFGGGLCQVATTLFRSILNAGLPITARSPHSYRVSYYEKDGNGKTIGPGLDATIYDPAPDLRFKNDTPGHILIMGSVVGDKVRFDFYGTKDGRVSAINGPHTLTTTPSGDPIYTQTTEVPEGTTKQLEKPHPGGSAIATYTVMRNGEEINKQVFKSVYRPWPARFLVGVSQATLDAAKNAAETAQPSENTPATTPVPPAPPGGVIPSPN